MIELIGKEQETRLSVLSLSYQSSRLKKYNLKWLTELIGLCPVNQDEENKRNDTDREAERFFFFFFDGERQRDWKMRDLSR